MEANNSAAMSEALEYLLKERDILDFCHNNLGSKTREDWDKVYKVLRKIIEKAMRAVAAPPRNCDVYTSDELKVKFNSELASELPIANEHEKNLVAITAMGVIDTLFAPATEKESEVQG